ncbi:MAG: 3-hydroxyacyl-CoA dehydrogenase family protein, partial [Halodesulfurarchaeum sp.]
MEYDVTVIGGGIMGYGLALQFGAQSQDVTLLDHREENLDRSKRRIRESLEFLDDRDVLDASPEAVFDRIGFTLDGRDALERTDVVLETISENLEAKRDLFEFVADVAPPTAVLATNTSGLEIGDIAEAVPEAANRVAGCHWWNPPYLMPLVEVVRGPETSTETIERLERFVEAVDRDPIRVNVDVPGIVWNRIQFAVLRE